MCGIVTMHKVHFITMAKAAHRKGMELRKTGLQGQAFAKFAERDVQMWRARQLYGNR